MSDIRLSRRKMIGVGAALAVGSGEIPHRLSTSEQMDTNSKSADVIDINLFTGSKLVDMFSSSGHEDKTPYYTTRRIAEHVEYAYTDLVETLDADVGVDVTVVETPVSVDELEYDIKGTLLSSWESHLHESVDDDDIAADSNLLLTNRGPADRRGNINGNAYAPCRACDGGNNTAGVLYNMTQEPFFDIKPGQIITRSSGGTEKARIPLAVHEVGHTLGLRHGVGEVRTEGHKYPHVTPMVTGRRGIWTIKLNTDNISRSDLRLAEDGGIGSATTEPSLIDRIGRITNWRL